MRSFYFLIATIFSLLFFGVTVVSNASPKLENRCGWFENSTPGNATFTDGDGEWRIAMQGEYQAAGDWPEFKPSQWVNTNRSYGYGCACLKVMANQKTHDIETIKSATPHSLATCRNDHALHEPH